MKLRVSYVCAAIMIGVLVGLLFSKNALGETIDYNIPMKAYNISIDGREYLQEGYVDEEEWENDFAAKVKEAENLNNELRDLEEYLSEENIAKINNFFIDNFKYIKDVQTYIDEILPIRDMALQEKQKIEQERLARQEALAASYKKTAVVSKNNVINSVTNYSGSSNNFKSQGVIYQNGIRYTYYSSNVAYHYRTPEWTAGADGIYRDSNGYIVVASSDYSQGTTVSTPFGQGKVYDSGCQSGTVDIYTKF